jgi:dihydroflavonol-4-reductase
MIVVTGATGHMGNVLVRQLLAEGETVRAVVPSWEDTTPLQGLKMEFVDGDVRNLDSLERAFEGADLVYHLAGIASYTLGNAHLLHEVNVAGTRNVVRACLETGVRRVVYASSIHAILEPDMGRIIDESLPFDPQGAVGAYATSVAMATLEVLKGMEAGLDAVIVCPTGVLGPYDYAPSEIGQLMILASTGELRAYLDGAYDFVDVRDVAQGLMLAAENGRTGESYILSGQRNTISDLVYLVEEASGSQASSLRVPIPLARVVARFSPLFSGLTGTRPLFTAYSVHGLAGDCLTTCGKATLELGYWPRPLKESVGDTLRWYKENGKLVPAPEATAKELA